MTSEDITASNLFKQIPLTQGKCAVVDNEDYIIVSSKKWYAKTNNDGKWYAARTIRVNGKNVTERMHRVIVNASYGMEVDHWDNDGLNNRRSNLRICTNSQNQFNKSGKENSSSQYKGVSKDQHYDKWYANISANNEAIYLGKFSSESEAALVYNEAALRLHGEFAKINILDDDVATNGRIRKIYPRGEQTPLAKLSVDKVRIIRASNEKRKVLAKKFNVSLSLVGAIKRGEIWN